MRSLSVFARLAVVLAASSLLAQGARAGLESLVINEVRLYDPASLHSKFFELRGDPGTSLDGVSYVVIGNDSFQSPPFQNGYVEDVVDLTGITIPASGYLVVGNPGALLPGAFVEKSFTFEHNNNKTHLLVKDFSGIVGFIVDFNYDGEIDSPLWTAVLDDVAFIRFPSPDGITGDFVYSKHLVGPTSIGSLPWLIYLCDGTGAHVSVDIVNDGTIGAANPNDCGLVRIEEVRVDQPGSDNDEYFELIGGPTAVALTDYTYLVIGDGVGGSGVIESVVDLSSAVIPAGGTLVVAENTFTLGVADVSLAASGLNFENVDNVTHMLVREFSGALNQDLDVNNDGTLDVTPWKHFQDSIALVLEPNPPTTTEWAYGTATVGPDGGFAPSFAYRCSPDDNWKVGYFDPAEGDDTPSAKNPACNVYTDLGSGLAGFSGVPKLIGTGSLAAGTKAGLVLTSARPSSPAALFVSLANAPTPFKGGLLVPIPALVTLSLGTGATGSIVLPFVWPSGVPAATSLYFQYAIKDAAGASGVALSNALRALTP